MLTVYMLFSYVLEIELPTIYHISLIRISGHPIVLTFHIARISNTIRQCQV